MPTLAIGPAKFQTTVHLHSLAMHLQQQFVNFANELLLGNNDFNAENFTQSYHPTHQTKISYKSLHFHPSLEQQEKHQVIEYVKPCVSFGYKKEIEANVFSVLFLFSIKITIEQVYFQQQIDKSLNFHQLA
jgi:hypothetical protein